MTDSREMALQHALDDRLDELQCAIDRAGRLGASRASNPHQQSEKSK
jgi:hypothetical protein